jgi:hypothetical protein
MTLRCALTLFFALTSVGAGAWAQTAAQSHFGKAERRDALFLRFPEMAQRYWVDTETMAASHKSVAIPMPKQCAFLYADAYTKSGMSEREVQETALSTCHRRLSELGPLGENYGVECKCQLVISDETYVVPRSSLPDKAYGPVSIFYRDDHGNVARLNGSASYGALIGRDRSVTFSVDNVRQEPVCQGTFTNEGTGTGKFSLLCFNGKFGGQGEYQSKLGQPNDHIVARGRTAHGLPIVMVIGLPAQVAASTYGGI